MDFEEFEVKQAQIEEQLESLQLAIKFLFQDYSYHHKNNESDILKTKLNQLLVANERFVETNEAYKELCLKLEAAKKVRDEAKNLLESVQMEYGEGSDNEDET